MKLIAKFWWKVYFWLMVGLAIGAILFELFSESSLGVWDVAIYGTWIFCLVGVFGFAFSQPILNRRLWQIWLPGVVIWDFAVLAEEYLHEPVAVDSWFIVAWVLVGVVLVLPEYVALYLYGYRSNLLWSAKP